MAITGRFVADFSDFDAAVKNATVELKGLETGSEKVEKSLNRMVDQFSGRKLIQDANLMVEAVDRIGGASKLTQAELTRISAKATEAATKMRALGMDVPKGLDALATATKGAGTAAASTTTLFAGLGAQLAGMFSVTAVLNFGRAVLETADAIQKMADQTGLSVEEVQSLRYIAGQTGTSISSMTNAVQTLQERLGSGNTGTVGALRQLGINLADFKNLNGYQQMVTVADALKGVESESQRAALAAAAFGRNWKELLPAVLSGMKELGEEAPKMSQAQVDALDRVGDAWTRLKGTAIAAAGQMAGVFVAGDTITQAAREWQATLDAVKPPLITFGQTLKATTMSATELAAAERQLKAENEAALKATKDREKAAADAAKELAKWADTYDRVSAAGLDWQEQVSRHDEQLVAHIQANLEAGRSVDELAEAFSIAKEDVAAMARALKENQTALELHDAAARETASLMNELYTLQIERSGTATDAAIANINLWANEYKARLMEAGILTAESENAIDAIRKEKIDALMLNWDTLDRKSQASLQERADIERRTYEHMLANMDRYSVAAIADQEAVARKAQEAADVWSTSMGSAADVVIEHGHRAAREHSAAAQQAALSWSQAMDLVRQGQGTMSGTVSGGPGTMTNYGPWGSAGHQAAVAKAYATGRYFGPVKTRGGGPVGSAGAQSYDVDWDALFGDVAGRASGGTVHAATPYVVGERGPELFVPSSSGDILPNGGGAMTNNFYVNGTGADVARVVMSELTRLMRVGRKWPAV